MSNPKNSAMSVARPTATSVIENGQSDRVAVCMANAETIMVRPFLILPHELRPAMYDFWLFWKMLKGMEIPVSVCTAINLWVEEYDLQIQDAIEVLKSTMRPSNVPAVNYGNDLLRLLAVKVSEVLKRRADEAAEQERRRRKAEEDSKPKATPEELEQWRKFRSEVFATGVIE